MSDEPRWTGDDDLIFDSGVVMLPSMEVEPRWWAWTIALAAAVIADPLKRGQDSFRRRNFGWMLPCGCSEHGAWYGHPQGRLSGPDGCAEHDLPPRTLVIGLDGRIARMQAREKEARERKAVILLAMCGLRPPTYEEEVLAAAIVRKEMG